MKPTIHVLQLPAAEIRPNPRQPRRVFDEAGLRELAASIRAHGVLQPLTVRRTAEGWELIAGERRLRASRLAGLETVPCIESAAGDEESALLALIENLQRQDLHYFEEAAAIGDYIHRTGITQEEAARQLGRSPSALANKLRLLKLSPGCVREILAGGLSERHARALLAVSDPEEQLAAAKYIRQHRLNVAQTERYLTSLPAKAPFRGKRSCILKDVRLFLNSVDLGLRVIREAGVDAQTERQETEDAIILTIRIPRGLPGKTVTGL